MKGIEKAYVVSDLHFGGEPADKLSRGFQINTNGPAFAKFVDWIAITGHRVELVLNGDTIDFLAEKCARSPQWRSFTADSAEAADKLNRVMDRYPEVFDALARFLQASHRLVLILGNHDIELSFPQVRERLRERLTADGKDFTFIYDGEAYVIDNVLIEHGNRYDNWNDVNLPELLKYRSALSRREPNSGGFSAPPGSEMVSTVINPIKKDYAFVDLLKPETEAVVPILLALAPQYKRSILQVLWLAAKAGTHPIFRTMRVDTTAAASAEVPSEDEALNAVLERTLGADAESFRDQVGLSGIQDRALLLRGERPIVAQSVWTKLEGLVELGRDP